MSDENMNDYGAKEAPKPEIERALIDHETAYKAINAKATSLHNVVDVLTKRLTLCLLPKPKLPRDVNEVKREEEEATKKMLVEREARKLKQSEVPLAARIQGGTDTLYQELGRIEDAVIFLEELTRRVQL